MLRLKYVPADAPLVELMTVPELAQRMMIVSHSRPIARVAEAAIDDTFRKSSNKSRINRLKRLGELKFERLRDIGELDRHLDDLIEMYEFRQGAAHGALPFEGDNLKREFHRRLMAEHPELIHATVFTCGDKLIAGHFGFASGTRDVHVAILAYSPFHAAHSPGKLALMYLIRRLREDGIAALDLTPGGDPWKERFATHHDTVYEATLYPSVVARTTVILQREFAARAKSVLARVGLTPARFRRCVELVRRPPWRGALRRLHDIIGKSIELQVYAIDLRGKTELPVSSKPTRDSLADLLKFFPAEPWQSRQHFLTSAMTRLEKGEHVYTFCSDTKLLHHGWLINNQQMSFASEVDTMIKFPLSCPVLYDFYTDPTARGNKLYQRNLSYLIEYLKNYSNCSVAFISALAENTTSCHVIRKVGGIHYCSVLSRSRFGVRQSPTVILQDHPAMGLVALEIIAPPHAHARSSTDHSPSVKSLG